MALVAAKCTECGASIEIDDCKESGVCRHCGTNFITQKIINNTFNIIKNSGGKGKKDKLPQDYISRGEAFLTLKDWEKAETAFEKAAALEPDNYKTWFGLVQAQTENFTDYYNEAYKEDLERAQAVANPQEKQIIDNLVKAFLKGKKQNAENKIPGYLAKIDEANVIRKAVKKANGLMWLFYGLACTIVFFLLLIPGLFYEQKVRKLKNGLLQKCREVYALEEELNKFGIPVPEAHKIWNEAKIRALLEKQKPSLFFTGFEGMENVVKINIDI